MAAIFSHKWTSQIESPTVRALVENEWTLGLQGLTPEQIQHGIDRARVECRWPPSIAEFIDLCLDVPSFAEFMAGHAEMDALAMKAAGIGRFDFDKMSIEKLREWRKTIYPVAAKAFIETRMAA